MRFNFKGKEIHLNEWHLSAILATPLLLMYLYYKFGSSYYYVDLPAGDGIPPDPGRWKNNSTLLGIDSDNDGVRDDVQRYIISRYKDNPRFRFVLNYFAGRYQKLLSLPINRKNIVEYYRNEERKLSCVLFVASYSASMDKVIYENFDSDFHLYSDVRAADLVFNTYSRRRAHNEKLDLLNGSWFASTPTNEINKSSCDQWYGFEAIEDE